MLFDGLTRRLCVAFLERFQQSRVLCELGARDFAAIASEACASIVAPYHRLVTPRKVEAAHIAGLRVVPWTANRPRSWARLLRAGVDGIITDDPAGLVDYLRAIRTIASVNPPIVD